MASRNLLCPVRREGQDHEVCVQEGCQICSGKQKKNFKNWLKMAGIEVINIASFDAEYYRRCCALYPGLLGHFSLSTRYTAGRCSGQWLVYWTLDWTVWVRPFTLVIVLYSWARHFALAVPFSTHIYKRVPANFLAGGNPVMDKYPIERRVEILLVT